MAEAVTSRMTPEEFLRWQKRQDRNFELVDGMPVLAPKAMTGATRRHDRVTVNILTALEGRLSGGPCFPATDDIAVRIPARGNLRRPDIIVDCGPFDADALEAAEPRVVIEVLSPSTMGFDRIRRTEEYKTVGHIHAILLVDTEAPRMTVWRRTADGFVFEHHDGADAVVPLPEIGVDLPLARAYRLTGLTPDGA